MCRFCRARDNKRRIEAINLAAIEAINLATKDRASIAAEKPMTVEQVEAEHKVKLEKLRKDYHFALKRNSENAHKHINALAFQKWERLQSETDEKKAKAEAASKFANDMMPKPDKVSASPDFADAMLLALTGPFKPGAVNEYVLVRTPFENTLVEQIDAIVSALLKDKPVLNKDREAAKAAAEEYKAKQDAEERIDLQAPWLESWLSKHNVEVYKTRNFGVNQGKTATRTLGDLMKGAGLRFRSHK